MKQIQPRAYIFSVCEHKDARQDKLNHFEALADLKALKLAHKPLIGCYKGNIEDSILLLDSPKARRFMQRAVKEYNQESVLFLDHDRAADLFYTKDKTSQSLGYLKSVSKTEALKSDAYTYCPKTNTYYMAK